MPVPNKVVEAACKEIKTADKNYVGIIIWRYAKENSGYSTNSAEFDAYKRELAQLVGRRGGNKNAKRIRTAKGQQTLKGIK